MSKGTKQLLRRICEHVQPFASRSSSEMGMTSLYRPPLHQNNDSTTEPDHIGRWITVYFLGEC
jgi:hypothetical protein